MGGQQQQPVTAAGEAGGWREGTRCPHSDVSASYPPVLGTRAPARLAAEPGPCSAGGLRAAGLPGDCRLRGPQAVLLRLVVSSPISSAAAAAARLRVATMWTAQTARESCKLREMRDQQCKSCGIQISEPGGQALRGI